jgi:AAA family ATP:ADP antiporter
MEKKNRHNQLKSERFFLLAYGAFAFLSGLFIAAFDVNVHSLFFWFFGYKYLATTYILGGIVGMATIYLFSLVYKRINTKSLSFLSITAIVLLCGAYLFLEIFWQIKWVYYYGMVIFFPANTLLVIILWRYARKLVKPSYTRIVLPKIKASFFSGIAVGGACFTLGLLKLSYVYLLYLTILTLFLLWLSVSVLNYAFDKLKGQKRTEEKYIPVRRNLFLFFSSKNTFFLFVFVFLSAMVGFSLHFVFVNLAWVEFKNIFGMSKFYGLFLAVSITFVFGVDKFLIRRILYSYDSPYSLILISPLILLGIIFVYLSPLLLGTRFSGEHFTLFFLIVTICKVGYVTLNYVIQTPSLRTLFYSLDLRYRQLAYPRVEGSMIMAGLTSAGVIFLGLSFLKFFSISIVLIFSGVLCLLWLWVTVKLIRNYRDNQQKELSKMRFRITESIHDVSGEEQLQKIYSSVDPEKITEALKLLLHIRPFEFENDLKRLILHPSEKVRQFVMEYIEKERVLSAIDDLKLKLPSLPDTEKPACERLIQKLISVKNLSVTEQLVREKLISGNREEKIDLVLAIGNSNLEDREGVLTALTKDYDPEIQNAAIRALAHGGSGDHFYTLIDYLYPEQYNPYAFDAIAASKEKAIDLLERESLLPGIDDLTLTRIIKLYGRVGTKSSVDLLLSKLGEIDSHVLMQSIQALVDNRFQATQEDKMKILSYIVKHIGHIVNNLSIREALQKKTKYSLLREAYQHEIQLNYQQLFKLLTLIYNPNIVNSLEKLFLYGNREEISHGIELADSYIDDDIKPLIFPLFEDIPDSDRLKKLEYFYPQPVRPLDEIISSTLTYDFNALSIYPRTCAILLIYRFKLNMFEEELMFCSNHPDDLLSNTARFVLQNLKRTDNVRNNEEIQVEEDNLLYSRFTKLITYPSLKRLSENVLTELAKSLKILEINAGENVEVDIVFNEYSLILVPTAKLISNQSVLWSNNQVYYLPLLKSMGVHYLKFTENCKLLAFSSEVINELIYDNPDLSRLIFSSIYNTHTAKQNEQ